MKCIENCAACCENIRRVVAGKYVNGLMLLPFEVPRLKKLGKKLGLKVEIYPQMGFGTKGRSRPRPKIIGTYQLANERCPFLRRKKCRIYRFRPLVCRSYPLSPMFGFGIEIDEMVIPFVAYGFDEKCPRVKEWNQELEKMGIKDYEPVPEEFLEKEGLMEEVETKMKIQKYLDSLILKYGFVTWVFDLKTMKWQKAPKPERIPIEI